MIEKIASHNLYPDWLRVYQINTSEGFDEKLIKEMTSTDDKIHTSKCRVDFRNHGSKEIVDELNKIYESAFLQYINELYEPEILDNFDFYQDWSINSYYDGKATFNHTHNDTFVVLAYYPSDTDGLKQEVYNDGIFELKTGQLVFSNPNGTPIWDRYAKQESKVHFRIQTKKGMLIAWQGYLPHWTVGGEKKPRYCMTSFIICKSKGGHKLTLTV